jgi:hypothetical protein
LLERCTFPLIIHEGKELLRGGNKCTAVHDAIFANWRRRKERRKEGRKEGWKDGGKESVY